VQQAECNRDRRFMPQDVGSENPKTQRIGGINDSSRPPPRKCAVTGTFHSARRLLADRRPTTVETFWNSCSALHRRIQKGGWHRQVNRADFPISTDIAGVKYAVYGRRLARAVLAGSRRMGPGARRQMPANSANFCLPSMMAIFPKTTPRCYPTG
jgi:hypothetical protein